VAQQVVVVPLAPVAMAAMAARVITNLLVQAADQALVYLRLELPVDHLHPPLVALAQMALEEQVVARGLHPVRLLDQELLELAQAAALVLLRRT
jgi:hypothetical protein